jgi:hypothetical protein
VSRLTYVGGGYFRDSSVPLGVTAETIRAQELLAERDATIARLTEALRHAIGLCLQPAEDFDEADSEWCHYQRAALEGKKE